MLEGALGPMAAMPGAPARYRLVLGSPGRAGAPVQMLGLNSLIGRELWLEFDGRINCAHCAAETRKSYGGGYCYPCFRRLARCDLCVVSPARCHYAAGTCREPAWGDAFCMQPHVVYLANSSGPKVGLTRPGHEATRWLHQGASQGLVVARAASRHLAGVLEARIAQGLADRTDWRAMVRGEAAPVDLPALRAQVAVKLDRLPDGVAWAPREPVRTLTYPVLEYPKRPHRYRFDRPGVLGGILIGVKGQYLLFPDGVFSVAQHRGYRIRAFLPGGAGPSATLVNTGPRPDQMELLS